MRIFLSYDDARRDLAERLALGLRVAGHEVFFDQDSLPAGTSYDDRIRGAILLSLLLSGCMAADAPPAAIVRDSAGVEIVETAVDRQPPATWHVDADPVLDIGGDADDAMGELFRVGRVLRLDDGSILIENRGTSEIRLFDGDGRPLRTIGRAGAGPGEFRDLSGVAASADTLFAYDADLRRVSLFHTAGELLHTFDLAPVEDPALPDGLGVHDVAAVAPGGGLWLRATSYVPRLQGQPMAYFHSSANVVVDRDGRITARPGVSGIEFFVGDRWAAVPPFGRRTRAAEHEGMLYVAHGGGVEVEVWEASGRLRRLVRVARPARPVTDALAEAALQERLAGVPPERHARTREREGSVPRPDALPGHGAIAVADDGSLWIQAFDAPGEEGAIAWDVIGVDGQWLARAELPRDFLPVRIAGTRLLGTWRDALGVEHVQVLRLRR